ncbi:MAG: type VI secretion system tip protein VgrG [Nitrospinae bacterium]|nr:type VI secretion system tip protein VgrG [Nitrospinota bacterium]
MGQTKKLNLSLTTPLGTDKLLIQKLGGTEMVSGLFRFDLEMTSKENNLSFDNIVGKNVTVTMDYGEGQKRYYNGIVGRFVQYGTDERATIYHAEVYPWLWLSAFVHNSRIFQEKSVPEIIKAVLSDLGFTDVKDQLKGTYSPREYCVQYQESVFDFVSRLMEDEGIFYFFEHESGKHTLVLADDASNHVSCPGFDKARLQRSGSSLVEDDVLTQCAMEQSVGTGKYAVDDFNFETPSADLLSSVDGNNKYRIYEYSAGFKETSVGSKIADKRLQAHELPTKLFRGSGYCRAFVAGFKFKVQDHERPDFNGEYVLREVRHSASQEDYANSFVSFPTSVPYRPPRNTRRPTIAGSQTAIVVGPSGEEIFTDKYGRVKVQFHWDQEGKKDENSSCWIRTTHGWAGKSWGSIFIPRIGQEVIVSFLEGNPDRPIITGMVYNAEQTVPYTLPDDKTKSAIKTRSSKKGDTKTFNEIRFQDLKGSEEFYMHAEKDMKIVVENNRTTTIGDPNTAKDGSETVDIKKNRTVTIKEGNEKLTVTKGNRTVDVQKGKETHNVKDTRTLTVTGNETHNNKADFTQNVTGNYTLNVDGDLLIDVKGKVTVKSGKDMLHQSSAKLTNKSTADLTNDAGANLKNKAAANLDNEAGANLTNKGGAKLENKAPTVTNNADAKLENKAGGMHDVTAGGILKLQGAMVKIN